MAAHDADRTVLMKVEDSRKVSTTEWKVARQGGFLGTRSVFRTSVGSAVVVVVVGFGDPMVLDAIQNGSDDGVSS